MSDESIIVQLTRDQALVLFEWLASLESKKLVGLADEAEQSTLWKVEGQLEAKLVEVFSADYRQLVENAKTRILS